MRPTPGMSIVCSMAKRPLALRQGLPGAAILRRACAPARAEGWCLRRAAGALAVGLTGLVLPALDAAAEPLAVEIANASEPVLCAEKDNVTLNLTSSAVRSFRITAMHPSYLGSLQRDSFEADWTACTAPTDPRAG